MPIFDKSGESPTGAILRRFVNLLIPNPGITIYLIFIMIMPRKIQQPKLIQDGSKLATQETSSPHICITVNVKRIATDDNFIIESLAFEASGIICSRVAGDRSLSNW